MDDPLHPLSQGCVCHLLFNEGTGSLAYDVSGHGNHGVLKNMLPNTQGSGWQGSKFGGGLGFEGSDDYVNCGNNASLDITDAITIEAWVKVAGDGTGISNQIVNRQFGAKGYRLTYNQSDDNFNFDVWNSSGLASNSYTEGISNNILYQVVGIFDGKSRIFLDGIEKTPGTIRNDIGDPDKNTCIGAYATTPTLYLFNGLIVQVRIYNLAVNIKKIKQLYHDPFSNLIQVPAWQRYVLATAFAKSHGYIF